MIKDGNGYEIEQTSVYIMGLQAPHDEAHPQISLGNRKFTLTENLV